MIYPFPFDFKCMDDPDVAFLLIFSGNINIKSSCFSSSESVFFEDFIQSDIISVDF